MFKFIEGMPADVLAVEATGKVTHEDYRDRLIPKAEAMMGHGPIRLLYVIGPAFSGFELGALVDDGVRAATLARFQQLRSFPTMPG